MSYWGTQRPILSYGTSYGTTWNLESDNVNVFYRFKHVKERNVNVSVLTNDANYSEIYSATKNTGGDAILQFLDLTDAQVEKLLSIILNSTIKIQYHADSPNNWSDIYIIKRFVMPAEEETGIPYPQHDTCHIELIKMTPAEIKNDTVT